MHTTSRPGDPTNSADRASSGGSKTVAFSCSSTKTDNDNGTSARSSGPSSVQARVSPRVRQVKFAVGLPQVQWLASSSSTTFSHRHRRHHYPSKLVTSSERTNSSSRPAEYSVQHQFSGSYSSYSSDDDRYDGDGSYYSDDGSSFTISSYSTNTYGTDPSGGSWSQEEGWRPNSSRANMYRSRIACSSGNAYTTRSQGRSHQMQQGRGHRPVDGMIGASDGGDKVKRWQDDANVPTGQDEASLHVNAKVGLVQVASCAARASAACPADSISGSSSSTRIIRNIQRASVPTSRFVKKIMAEVVSSVAMSSSTEAAIRRDSELQFPASSSWKPIADNRNDQENSPTRERNAACALNDSNREGESQGPSHQPFHSILKKSKYSSASSSQKTDFPSSDGAEYESSAAVEQLKEDLSALAGETAASFSLAVTSLGAGTDDFIDKACQMGITDIPDHYSSSDDGEFDYTSAPSYQQKAHVKNWRKEKGRGRSPKRKWRNKRSGDRRNSSASWQEGRKGAKDIFRELAEDKASGQASESHCTASAPDTEGIGAKASNGQEKKVPGIHILERLHGVTPSVQRSESSSDNMKMSQDKPVGNSDGAGASGANDKKTRSLPLGQSIVESGSIGTPIESASGCQGKDEKVEGGEDTNAMANSSVLDTDQHLSLLRSMTLSTSRISEAVGSIPDQEHKIQGTLVLGKPDPPKGSNEGGMINDQLLGSTLIVGSPPQTPIWQSSNNGKTNNVSSNVTVSTIGADSPAIIAANSREMSWLKNSRNKQDETKLNFSPVQPLANCRDSLKLRGNKKKRYCAVASILLVTTVLWISIGAFLWRRFSTTGSPLASINDFEEEEEDGLGDSAFVSIRDNPLQSVQKGLGLVSQSPTLAQPTPSPSTFLPTSVPSRAPTMPTLSPTGQSESPTNHPAEAEFVFDVALQTTSQSNQVGCIPGLEAQYKDAMIDWIGQDSYDFLDQYHVFDLGWRVKAAFDQDPWDEYFGKNGEYTDEVLYLFEKVGAFWKLGGVRQDPHKSYTLRAVRGSIVDEDGFSTTLAFVSLFDMSFQEATDAVQDVREVISSVPDGYDNALLSFQALYYELGPNTGGVFILGDGMLDYLNHYGRGDAPFGLALENSIAQMFGQYLLHSVLQYPAAEHATLTNKGIDLVERKYRDLLATALAGYYIAHPTGGNVSGEALCRQYPSLARSKGTCDDDRPNQGRLATSSQQVECVATWAARIARENAARILNPAEIHRRFEQAFPEIMANYWKVCSPLTEEECGMDSSGPPIEDSAEKDLPGSVLDAVAEAKTQNSSSSPSAERVSPLHILVSQTIVLTSMWVFSTMP